jgi:hypothetical protein
MNQNSPTQQQMSPQDLTNQLFNAMAVQCKHDPQATAQQTIVFLTTALFYAVRSAKHDVVVFLIETLINVATALTDDEASRKELLKNIGDTITNAPPLPAGKPEAGKQPPGKP